MPAILIDYEAIISPNFSKKFKSPPPEIKNFLTGLILILNKNILQKLSKIPMGKERINFLSNIEYIDSLFVFYNPKKEICILPEIKNYFEDILSSLFSGLPKTTTLLYMVNDLNSIPILAKHGFHNPYIFNSHIVLSRSNIPNIDTVDINTVVNKVKHILEEKNKDGCSLHIKFLPRAINFLKKASKSGISVDKDGKSIQNELTGELVVKNVIKEGKDFIYNIDINEDSVSSGEEENVDVNATRYNFHSHPEQAYIRYGVDRAWPSLTDYLGYLHLGNKYKII